MGVRSAHSECTFRVHIRSDDPKKSQVLSLFKRNYFSDESLFQMDLFSDEFIAGAIM